MERCEAVFHQRHEFRLADVAFVVLRTKPLGDGANGDVAIRLRQQDDTVVRGDGIQAGGQRLDEPALRAQLALAGYQSVTNVISPGEFSIRGGLIDLFPMGSALPKRSAQSRRHPERRHPWPH